MSCILQAHGGLPVLNGDGGRTKGVEEKGDMMGGEEGGETVWCVKYIKMIFK